MSETMISETLLLVEKVEELGSERWPLLARCLQDVKKAYSTKVEWLLASEAGVYGAVHNFTQIFRDADLERLLDRLEYELRRGRRAFNLEGVCPVSTMGGVYELIGRWPEEDDHVALWVLRGLIELKITRDSYGVPLDTPRTEWLCEVSLYAARAEDL